METLITENRIFRDRTEGIGTTQRRGRRWTGGGPGRACAPAASPTTSARRYPYLGYETYDFKVPIAHAGDTYARYLVRVEEMRQSLAHRRAGAGGGCEPGPVIIDDHHVALPAQGEGLHRDGVPDLALQADHGGHEGAGRGDVRLHRGRQRRARLLHRVGRRRQAVPHQGPAAVLRDLPGLPAHARGAAWWPTPWPFWAASTSSPGSSTDEDRAT